MRLVLFLLVLASSLPAAEPDWPALERQAVDLLQRYLRVPSINPPADMRPAAALLKAELEKDGFAPTVYTSGPNGETNLLVRFPGRDRTKKPLLLLSHMDVVPVDRAAWRVDPFGGELRDGWIWGRGALDMKGVGVMQLVALAAMKRAGIVPARDIILLYTADEETGGKLGAQWMIDRHWKDLDPAFVMDEGGLGTRDVIAAGKLVFGVAVGEKQLAWLRLRAKGTAAHGSQPIPDNANLILLQALEKAMQLPAGSRPSEVLEHMKRAVGTPLADNKFIRAIQRNTASLTTLRAGVGDPPKANVIPSASEATLDCRLLPGVNAEEFVSEMKARINDPRVAIEVLNRSEDAPASPSNTTLFRAIEASIKTHHPTAVVTPMLVPYGTDSHKLRLKNVPSYGLIPMVLDAATLATMHSDEERIPVAEFLKGLRIYFDVLRSDF